MNTLIHGRYPIVRSHGDGLLRPLRDPAASEEQPRAAVSPCAVPQGRAASAPVPTAKCSVMGDEA
ncbi:hypothetical protein [Streptomyces sp. NPDC005423]|uniref:hypothetical protein n=1 Tax=Streptomyces sp. NPDC005423 TaxID=3155343 RepID=UPI0033BA64AB